jgi:hypothetical protein
METKLYFDVINYKGKKYISRDDLVLGLYEMIADGHNMISPRDLADSLKQIGPSEEKEA